MVKIRSIQENDYPQAAEIWRNVLDIAEKLAIENATRYLGLASGFMRDEAHTFYEHMGYKKTSYRFRKSL